MANLAISCWTQDRVKAELPNVRVVIGKRELIGRVSGRRNQCATVTVDYITNGKPTEHLRGAPWVDFHTSWASIAYALNENHPLQF